MTLNLTIANTFGVWQCTDHRLTDPASGTLVDDYSVKHICLQAPDGSALLAFTGVGSVKGVYISDWVREILRGETRSLDQSLIFLRENASRDLGPVIGDRFHHAFSIGAFLAGRPWVAQVRNFHFSPETGMGPPLAEFVTIVERVERGLTLVSGTLEAVSDADWAKLRKAAARKPRQPRDFMQLLAAVNQRAAEHPKFGYLISPHCTTTYLHPKGEPFESEFHAAGADSQSLVVPILFLGIDLTEGGRVMLDHFRQLKESGDFHSSEFDARAEEAAKKSVTPLNRLRNITRK